MGSFASGLLAANCCVAAAAEFWVPKLLPGCAWAAAVAAACDIAPLLAARALSFFFCFMRLFWNLISVKSI